MTRFIAQRQGQTLLAGIFSTAWCKVGSVASKVGTIYDALAANATKSFRKSALAVEIWDLHSHISGLPGRTPDERMVQLIKYADRMGIGRLLVRSGEVYVEIAMLERLGGVANLLNEVPLERVLFGSHTPFFYFESALLKLKEWP